MFGKILLLSTAVVFIFFAFSCGKKAENTITIATDATWPPMEFLDENREIVGFEVDMINLVAKEGGFRAELKNTAWDGIFAGLATGEYDAVLSSVTITEDRQKTMDFSIPYINAGQVLIIRQETIGVTTLNDLKGSSVGAQIGTTGAFEVEKVEGVDLKTYDELGMAIEDLANKRIEGVVADTPIAADYVLQNDTYKDKLKIVGEPFTEELYGIAVKKGNTEVLDKINKGLEKVLKTAVYEQLKKKWLQ